VSNRCANGSPFHTEGPTTKNARVCLVNVQAKGTKGTPVPLSGGSCDLWCPGWESKDFADRWDDCICVLLHLCTNSS